MSIRYRRFDRREFPGGFNREQARFLADRDPATLVDQLMIYVLVSGVQTDLSLDKASLAFLHERLRQNSGSIREAFVLGRNTEIDDGLRGKALITRGCIEVSVEKNSYWGMFKAFWAENRGSPQCR